MKRSRRPSPASVPLAMLLASLLAEPVSAQRAVPITNADERGRVPYNLTVEFSTSGCLFNCSNFALFSDTTMLFDAPAVPTGKRLIVEWVSASLPASSSANSISFQSSRIIANQRALWQYHGPYYGVSGTDLRGMSSGAFFSYGPGETPHIRVYLTAASGFLASISIGGYLIEEP